MNSIKKSTSTLQSLNDFIAALSKENKSNYNKLIQSVDLSSNSLLQFSSWSTDNYTRNCIAHNDKFELILLCWEAGQITPIHCHGGEECWVKVIEGDLEEKIYQENTDGNLELIKSAVTTANEVTYMIDFMGFHSLKNLSSKRSMTLHLYAKPIAKCRIFDEAKGEFVVKELSYDTIA